MHPMAGADQQGIQGATWIPVPTSKAGRCEVGKDITDTAGKDVGKKNEGD
jgi:hypothetical protein